MSQFFYFKIQDCLLSLCAHNQTSPWGRSQLKTLSVCATIQNVEMCKCLTLLLELCVRFCFVLPCNRKSTVTSACKGFWTPPWTARCTRRWGAGWRWKKPRPRWGKEGCKASPWRTVTKRTTSRARAHAGLESSQRRAATFCWSIASSLSLCITSNLSLDFTAIIFLLFSQTLPFPHIISRSLAYISQNQHMWSFQSLHALTYAVTQTSLSPTHRNKQRKTHHCRRAWTSRRANDCIIMTRECFNVTLLKNDLAVALLLAIFHLLLCWFLVEFCSPSLSSKHSGDISKVTSVCWAIESSVSFSHTRTKEIFLFSSAIIRCVTMKISGFWVVFLRNRSAHCLHATMQYKQNNLQLVMWFHSLVRQTALLSEAATEN